MQKFPHFYTVKAAAETQGAVAMETEEGATLQCFPPSQFGGEPGRQSPESLLAEAVASCFILTFRAVASASGLAWSSLQCQAIGKLDKVDGRLAFTEFALSANLKIAAEADQELARKLLAKAEGGCLVSASLACPVLLNEMAVTW